MHYYLLITYTEWSNELFSELSSLLLGRGRNLKRGHLLLDDSVVNNVRTQMNYVSPCAEKMLHTKNPAHNNNIQAFRMFFEISCRH